MTQGYEIGMKQFLHEIVHNLEELFKKLSTYEKNFIIGGGEIYRQLLPYVSEIFLTCVNEKKSADTFFKIFFERFICDSSEKFKNFEFKHYRRK